MNNRIQASSRIAQTGEKLMKLHGADDGSNQTVWTIDCQYSTLQFSSKLAGFLTVTGSITEFAAEAVLDEAELSNSTVEATISAASLKTGIERRDAHLRSEDFLDAERFPNMHFQSTRFEKGRDRDTLRITGNLMVRGQNREITLDVWMTDRSRSPVGEEIFYCTAMATIDRHAFGVSYARWLIASAVKITVQIQAAKRS